MEKHNYRIKNDSDGAFESVDLEKLRSVFLRSLPIILLVLAISLSISSIAIRYTKQLFQSSSILQLDVKSEAKVLGFRSFDDDVNNLAREIEIIRSRLFLSKVAETLNYNISYFQHGDILFEERYGNSSFKVAVVENSPFLENRKIDLDILDQRTYQLKYEIGGETVDLKGNFGDPIIASGCKLLIELTQSFDPDVDNKYFFTINSHASILNYINSNLTVEPLDFKAKTINISFKDHNRQKAHDVVHAIDTLYVYFTQLEKNKANKQKIDFLDQQLGVTEKKLTELENYFEDFTIDNKTTDLSANLSKTILLLEELDSQRFSIQNRLKGYDEVYDQIIAENDFDLNPANLHVFPSEMRQELDRLSTLYQDKEMLANSYNANTLVYQKKVQEINYLKDRLLKYIESTRISLYEKLDGIKSRKSRLESEFAELPSKRTEFSKTERFYGLYEDFYLSLMQNKAAFELAQAGTVAEYKVLSPASMPITPISPDKIIYYGIGTIAGLFLSFLFVGTRYLLHNKITSQSELERLSNAFVLGTIPYYPIVKKNDTRLVVTNNLKSEISESFRTIRTNLEFLNNTDEKPIMAITSTVASEGKTFIAANLGGIMSLLKNKVILLDLDMRKPRFHEVFDNCDPSKGLSTILIKKHDVDSCIHNTDIANLDYIPAGPIPPNPSELILGRQFDDLLEYLKTLYDVIIIDTPPVGLVTDGIRALKIASIPIYVVRADFSKKVFIKDINRMVKVHKLTKMSLILNSLKKSSKGSYYDKKGYYEEKPVARPNRFKRIFQS